MVLGLTGTPASSAVPAVPAAPASPASVARPGPASVEGVRAAGTGAEVARLFTQAAKASARYEAGRRAARTQAGRARVLERRLRARRAELTVLHGDLGRLARAQYRTGGQLPQVARLLLADDPGDLLWEQHAAWQASRSVTHAVRAGRRAERRLAAEKKRASAQWRALTRRNARLSDLKNGIEKKLAAARDRLQGEAEESVATGKCPPAVRLAEDTPGLAESAAQASEAWVAPVHRYELSAGYDSSGTHWSHRHTGQDFAVDLGTPVHAVGAGKVVRVGCGGPFGIEVVLRHPDGYYTHYAHLAGLAVDEGQEVATGQWIAESGSTGNSTGPHLHFEVRLTPDWGSEVDPVAWLEERGVTL